MSKPKLPGGTDNSPHVQQVPKNEELERERLEPGLNTAGKGDAGADPARRQGRGNSNT